MTKVGLIVIDLSAHYGKTAVITVNYGAKTKLLLTIAKNCVKIDLWDFERRDINAVR